MKRIYFTLIVLLAAMLGMAYLYFSRLNRESAYNEISLNAATANSGLIFCMQNDRSIFEILKGQELFRQLLGDQKFNDFNQLKEKIIASPAINTLIANQNIYFSFLGGKNKEIDYLISTQLNNEDSQTALTEALKAGGMTIKTTGSITQLSLNDSTHFYMAIDKNLLLLSNQPAPVQLASKTNLAESNKDFTAYIKSNNTLNKNSVGNLFIDFAKLPLLLKSVLPGALNGNLSILAHQQSFAALNYNFSQKKLFFSGSSKVSDPKSYLNLFSALTPEKNSIDNLLPASTANFTLYAIPSYKTWRISLNKWFELNKEDKKIKKIITGVNTSYYLNTDDIFPVYFKNQLITFQLKSSEDLGAINLSNGDKVKQLLLDISQDYDQDIKSFKVAGLLYSYFGEPFKKFSRPYYTIIDNNLIFANNPSTLQVFLNAYKNNKLLITTAEYADLYTQASNSASVTFYANHRNSADLARHNLYLPFYRHFLADKGLGIFSAVIYQLNGDKGIFLTNFLINTKAAPLENTTDDEILAN